MSLFWMVKLTNFQRNFWETVPFRKQRLFYCASFSVTLQVTHVNVKWNRRLVWYNHYHHESTKLYQKKITRLLLLALYFRLLATTFASHADLSAVTLFTYSVLPWSTVAGYHVTCKTHNCYIICWLSTYEKVYISVTRPFFLDGPGDEAISQTALK